MKPLTIKLVDIGISNLKAVFFCYLCLIQLDSYHSLDCFSVVHNLEFPLSKPKKVGTLDCGKLCFLTMQNYVAHPN